MLKELVKKHLEGCLMLVKKTNDTYIFVCSAFFCSNKGYALTCAHAIDLSSDLYLIIPNNKSEFKPPLLEGFTAVKVRVAQFDPLNDVALLNTYDSISASLPKPSLLFANEEQILIGSSIGYFGFPFATRGLQTIKVSTGIISSKVLGTNGTKTLQIDTTVNDGNSGGPLFDVESSRIIGIISGRFSPTGNEPIATLAGIPLGQDSNISYAVGISYGIALMKEEGIYE